MVMARRWYATDSLTESCSDQVTTLLAQGSGLEDLTGLSATTDTFGSGSGSIGVVGTYVDGSRSGVGA